MDITYFSMRMNFLLQGGDLARLSKGSRKGSNWVKKSIELSRKPGYLDKLMEIYPSDIPEKRRLDEEEKKEIVELHNSRDGAGLLRKLLEQRNHPFPFEHPYVPLLSRKRDRLFEKNPEIVKKLGGILLSKEVDEIIKGCERPPDINRIMGSSFRDWVKGKFSKENKYPVLPESDFIKHDRGIAILDATNAGIREYVGKELKVKLGRGRDLLIKVDQKHLLGEARYLSTTGGSQRRDLEETINFVKGSRGKIIRVAILDGVMWFDTGYVKKLCELEECNRALSSLLLKDFLEELRRNNLQAYLHSSSA